MSVVPPLNSAMDARSPIAKTPSDFDAGINSSAAWTTGSAAVDVRSPRNSEATDGRPRAVDEALTVETQPIPPVSSEREGSDDMGSPKPEVRWARVVYNFSGKEEFQELTVKAGDEIEVLEEILAEGWSLARLKRSSRNIGNIDVGLIPRLYYVVSSLFCSSNRVGTNKTKCPSSQLNSFRLLVVTGHLSITLNIPTLQMTSHLRHLCFLRIPGSGFVHCPISGVAYLVGGV